MITKLLKVFILSLLFMCSLFSKSLALTIVEIKENAYLTKEDIFLEDIAKLNNPSLNKVYIGKLPLPGRKRYITQDYVKLRILQAKIKEEDFKLTGAKEIEITSASQKLDIEGITEITKKYLLDNIKTNQRVEIEKLGSLKDIILPVGKVEYKLGSINNQNLKGQIYLPVDIKVNGTKYRTINLGFKIRQFGNVVVADKLLNRHHILTPSDIEIQEKEVTYINPAALNEVIGKRLKTSVREGRILTYDLVEIPPLIKKGDMITIKKESKFLLIGTKGIAKEDGRAGDKIKVENIDSKKIIIGIVEDENTVKVE